MGLDPVTGLLLSSVAGQGLGAIFAPEGQELEGFQGKNNPNALLDRGVATLDDILQLVLSEAANPPTINTSAAPLPSFVGGGLPMTIGAPALDPNRRTPSRRSIPGLNVDPETSFRQLNQYPHQNEHPIDDGGGDDDGGEDDGGGYGNTPFAFSPGPAASPMPVSGDPEIDQAQGALELLMFGSGGRRQPAAGSGVA